MQTGYWAYIGKSCVKAIYKLNSNRKLMCHQMPNTQFAERYTALIKTSIKPMISGQIALRKLIPSDKVRLADLANNKKIWDNVRDYFPHPYTVEDADKFIEITEKEAPQTTFAITFNDEFVGITGLILRTDVHRKSAEIGYWIGEPYWNKGITSQAIKLLINYGFNNLDLIRIDTGVFESNKASCRVLEKSGFEFEGIFKKSIIKNGIIFNEMRYGIIKKENAV